MELKFKREDFPHVDLDRYIGFRIVKHMYYPEILLIKEGANEKIYYQFLATTFLNVDKKEDNLWLEYNAEPWHDDNERIETEFWGSYKHSNSGRVGDILADMILRPNLVLTDLNNAYLAGLYELLIGKPVKEESREIMKLKEEILVLQKEKEEALLLVAATDDKTRKAIRMFQELLNTEV